MSVNNSSVLFCLNASFSRSYSDLMIFCGIKYRFNVIVRFGVGWLQIIVGNNS